MEEEPRNKLLTMKVLPKRVPPRSEWNYCIK